MAEIRGAARAAAAAASRADAPTRARAVVAAARAAAETETKSAQGGRKQNASVTTGAFFIGRNFFSWRLCCVLHKND
jgi:hypothetical protein